MPVALNPQPLPPKAPPTEVRAAVAVPGVTSVISPVHPITCPTCTSGRFLAWDQVVNGRQRTIEVTVASVE